MRNNKGFSLVELIVVIAIMAILAAIAIPTFAHFITKANQASDDELLHNINYIFNAACLENGVDVKEVTAATWSMDKMLVTSVKVNGVENEKIVASFAELFDITDAKFKLVKSIAFDPLNHEFVAGNADGSVTITYGGATITLNPDDIAALKNSTFGEMGMETLLGQLDEVSGIAAEINHELMNGIIQSDDFRKSAAKALGIDVTAADWETQLDAKYTVLLTEYFAQQNPPKDLQDATAAEKEAAIAQINANATILYTAQQTTNVMSRDDINAFLANPSKQTIMNNMDPTKSEDTSIGLAQASLICGLYTSYVNSSYGAGLTDDQKVVDVPNVLYALENDANFKTYLNSEQGVKDTDAYLSSLNMINGSTQNSDAVSQLMINGFGDPELVDQFNQSMGK